MNAVWRRLFPWLVRAAWIVLPFTVGSALAGELDARSAAVRSVASVLAWTGWVGALVASLVPHPVSLTVLRMATPAAAVVTAFEPTLAAVVATAVLVMVVFAPETGRHFVNGPAYPNERRYPLRVPGPLLVGPLALAWVATIGAPVAGVLLLAAGRWVGGVLVLAGGVPLAVVLGRSIHALSRRWVVFVPAGVVLHDPITLADPILFRRQTVERLAPAGADADRVALDLTAGATGLALELVLRDEVEMVLQRAGRRSGETVTSARLLFTPTRPGAVVEEATSRRVPVR